MKYYKNLLSMAVCLFLGAFAMSATAQTLCDFESPESYAAVGVYDTWADSPFREGGALYGKGNAMITPNPDKADDPVLGFAPNASEYVLGAQRSRFGSNTFGAVVELREPFALKRRKQYVHIKVWTPTESRVMLIGMGQRTDRPWQPLSTEQFWATTTTRVTPGHWFDAVFPVSGADGINIHRLLLVPDLESPHHRTDDFLFYIDDIELSDQSTPRFTTDYYPINYSLDEPMTRNDRMLGSISLTPKGEGEQSISVNQGNERRLYLQRMEQSFTAKAGQTLTPKFQWTGSWMHGYVYLDVKRDGKFNVAYNAAFEITEPEDLMTYSYFKGRNTNGAQGNANPGVNPPAFTLPADLKPGVYRMRYKVDWDDVDPGGSITQSIAANGGAIVDTRLIIHEDNVTISRGTRPNGGGLNGDVLKADGSPFTQEVIPFGEPYTVRVSPAPNFKFSHLILRHGFNLEGDSLVFDTPQYVDTRISASQFKDNAYTIPAKYIDGDVIVIPYFSSDDGEEADDYALNFDPTLEITRTDRHLNSFSMKATKGGESQVVLNAGGRNSVYRKMLDSEVSVVPGDVVTTTVNYTGNAMHAYLYVDMNQDGQFDAALDDDGLPAAGSELMAFSFYRDKNSLGESKTGATGGYNPPAFTLPAELPAGNYRARLKIDWNNIDPAGQWKLGGGQGDNQIDTNGGYVVDFLLNVHPELSPLDVRTQNGAIVGEGHKGLPARTAFRKALSLLPVAPDAGYQPGLLTIRHGHGLDGEQYIHGNRQWSEYTVKAEAGKSLSLPSDSVNGEVRLTLAFTPDGTETYTLRFADEFDLPDGSLPDAAYWTRCQNHATTCKRFNAQTPLGQQLTAFIEDGKLTMRCLANPYDDETDSSGHRMDMISGAVESAQNVYFRYGKVECRLKTTGHAGNFPAFWMMPEHPQEKWPYCGEIDIWEQIDADNVSYHTIHSKWANGTDDGSECKGQGNNPPKYATAASAVGEYHVYGLEWTPEELTWYVDGQRVFSYARLDDAAALRDGQWPFDQDFHLILNQSVGDGSWAAAADVDFVYETLFDWVRIYQKDGQTGCFTGIHAPGVGLADVDWKVEQGVLTIQTAAKRLVNLYDASGRAVFSSVVDGAVRIPLSVGVYLLDGCKVLVH